MLENINIDSSVPVYIQIENHVQFAIASGRLKPGDQLPPVIGASQKLGVNQNTVAKAYRDLEVMGLLYTRRGMGCYVAKGAESKCREDCRRQVISRLHEVIAEANAAGMSSSAIMEIAKICCSSDVAPYGETPKSLLAMAKSKK